MNKAAMMRLMLAGLVGAIDAGNARGKHGRRPKNYRSAKARAHARTRRALAKAGRKAARRRDR